MLKRKAECRILKWSIENNKKPEEMTEEKAEQFVTSLDNILRMIDPSDNE